MLNAKCWMIFMGQAEEYQLNLVPPQADTCTFCSLLNNFSFAVCRLPFHVLTILKY